MLDELDLKILNYLLMDARKKFKDIAKECGVSLPTIRNRYNKMKNEGIILGSTIFTDPKNFGYEQVASIFIDVKPEKIDDFLKIIKEELELFSIHVDSAKEYNVHVEAYLKETRLELQRLVQKIRHEAVLKMKVALWLETLVFPENMPIDHIQETVK